MPNSAEKNRERRKLRYWVANSKHRDGGWLEAPVTPDMHGKFGTYSNWGCRCPGCEIANEEHSKTYRARISNTLRRTLDHVVPSQRKKPTI